jgi:hypothetical protein
VGVLNGGGIVGVAHAPFMQLTYGAQFRRLAATYTPIGSMASDFTIIPTVYPCDVAPMSDDIVMQQYGQQEYLTHVLHFQAGTDVRVRDEVLIVYAPQPGGFGNVGDVYLIAAVLTPSEDLNYVRCRALKQKAVPG